MERLDLIVAQSRPAGHQAQLVERQSLFDPYREGQRNDLEVQASAVAGADLVEPEALVGDHPGEHVEPPGRALGVRPPPEVGRELQLLDEGDEVRALRLQDGPLAPKVELIDHELLQLQLHRASVR